MYFVFMHAISFKLSQPFHTLSIILQEAHTISSYMHSISSCFMQDLKIICVKEIIDVKPANNFDFFFLD